MRAECESLRRLKTYYEMVQASVADRLILDLSDNGGGVVDMAPSPVDR